MSRHWYAYTGYGSYDYTFEYATYEGCMKLLDLCSDYYKKVFKEESEQEGWKPDMKHLNQICFDEDDNLYGVYGLFVDAVDEQEHIRLTFSNGSSEAAVILEPYYPWCPPQGREAILSPAELTDIYCKYFDILGIPRNKQYVAYLDVIGSC